MMAYDSFYNNLIILYNKIRFFSIFTAKKIIQFFQYYLTNYFTQFYVVEYFVSFILINEVSINLFSIYDKVFY